MHRQALCQAGQLGRREFEAHLGWLLKYREAVDDYTERLAEIGYGSWPKLGLFAIPPWIRSTFARSYHMWRKGLATMQRTNRYPMEHSMNLFGIQTCAGSWSSWYLAGPLGIQTCRPFLDPRLISFSLSLPREAREVPGVSKPLLQAAMRGVLPEPIRTRRFKRSFNDVFWTGLSQNLPYLEDMVHRP
jgi:asparagine synthase (glutamine-hydrolysing)